MNDFVDKFVHPEDAAALKLMKSLPGFDLVVKKVLDLSYETLLYGINMASKIRLSEKQMPKLYHRLVIICKRLGIEVPEFYLEMNPYPNAYTFGDTRIFLVVTSGLLQYLKEDEVDSVLAHECGHILCRHVLYTTMADILKTGGDALGLLGPVLVPLQYAMLYWSRKSELSADRVGAIISGKDTVVKTQLRLAGGPEEIMGEVNVEEWAKQADCYEEIRDGKTWDKFLQIIATAHLDHPFAAVRVKEILKWCDSSGYRDALEYANEHYTIKTKCPRCGAKVERTWIRCAYCDTKL